MFVCASTSVVFDARRQVSMARRRLADDERWAMLNKTTFQEILNAILVQSTFPLPAPHQPPSPPPPPPPPLKPSSSSSSAIRRHRSATLRPPKKLMGARGGGCEEGNDATATKFCFGGEGGGGEGGGEGGGGENLSTDLAPARENEILTRIEDDDREIDRCRWWNEAEDLHLTQPSSSSSSAAAAAAAAGRLTSSNISLQKNLSVGRTNSTKTSDLQRLRPPKGASVRLAYSVPLQSPPPPPSPQILSGAADDERVDRSHRPEHKGAARKCSLDVASTFRQVIKHGAGIENLPCAKDPSLISPLLSASVVVVVEEEDASTTKDKDSGGDQKKREDRIGDWSRDPIRETRGNRSRSSSQKGSKEAEEEKEEQEEKKEEEVVVEEEHLDSGNRSKEEEEEEEEDRGERSEDAAVDVDSSSGLLRSTGDRVDDGGTTSRPPPPPPPPPVARLDRALGAVAAKRPPTTVANRTLQARNLNARWSSSSSGAEIIGRRQPEKEEEEEEEEEEEGEGEEEETVEEGQRQMSVAIDNCDLMKENGAFGLPWSRWIAMDKSVLLCIIEHVLSVDIFGSNQMFSLTTTTTKNKKKNGGGGAERTPLRRTECYPVPGHPQGACRLQWSTPPPLRPCRLLPGQSSDGGSDSTGAVECCRQKPSGGERDVRSVGSSSAARRSGRSIEDPPPMKPELQLLRKNNRRRNTTVTPTDNTTVNAATATATATTVSVVSNAKPTRRARSGVLLLRKKKRRGQGPPPGRSLRLGTNGGDNGGGVSVEGNGGVSAPADFDAAAHDKSQTSFFKWKSEMITRLIHETNSTQDLAAVS